MLRSRPRSSAGSIFRAVGSRRAHQHDAPASGLYQQILTLSLPAIEYLRTEESPALARLRNEGMAEIVAAHPEYFGVRRLAADEQRARVHRGNGLCDRQLGAKGIQIFTTSTAGRSTTPSSSDLRALRKKNIRLAIWLHPVRTSKFADYPAGEIKVRDLVAVRLGPMKRAPCMARIVFSEMFDKLPTMKIITHHCGAMAPFFDARIELGWPRWAPAR